MSIPKIIHQIWLGDDIPIIQTLYMNKWRTMKGWKYVLWKNNSLTKKNFPKSWNYIQRSLDIGKELGKNKFAQIADLMRLEILYNYGGLYADATLEPLKNFNKLIKSTDRFVISNEDPCGFHCQGYNDLYYMSNSFIASVPKHTILKRALNKRNLDKINFRSLHVNVETGPYYIRKHIKEDEDDITLIETRIIYPHGYETQYKDETEDLCFFYNKNKKSNIKIKKPNNENVYLQYPCNEYPDSYSIKHWDIGGSWIR